MCLISKNYFTKIAWRDVVCYKVVKVNQDGSYETPIQHTKIDEDVLSGKKNFIAIGDIERHYNMLFKEHIVEISGGVIHSIGDLESVSNFIEYSLAYPNSYVVYRCIIPRGTRYFTDRYNRQYASKKIKFVEQVDCRKII